MNLMVASLRKTNPTMSILQCSDQKTLKIDGVSEVFRLDSDSSNLMSFRLESFAALKMKRLAIYVDTDMLFLRPLNPLFGSVDSEVICCKRSFGFFDQINPSFRGMDLEEYRGKSLGEIYPFIACFTATTSSDFWSDCLENLMELEEKFRVWYGDQEAIRNIVRSKNYRVSHVPESMVACLPEFAHRHSKIYGLHFKGPRRKALMKPLYSKFFSASKEENLLRVV